MLIDDFEDVVTKTNFRAFVHTNDIVNGKSYDKDKINFIDKRDIKNNENIINIFDFEVDSEDKNTYFDVQIFIQDGNSIIRTRCDCKSYRYSHSCEHIAAVFVNYYQMFFSNTLNHLTQISNNILDSFIPENNNGLKKELTVKLFINIEEKSSYYYYGTYEVVNAKVMLGEDKLYVLGNHATSFKYCLDQEEGTVKFGKSFTYDPSKYYISQEGRDILNAYFDLIDGSSGRYYSDRDIKNFFSKLKNISFIIEDYQVDGIIDGFFIETNLSKEDSLYELSFDIDNVIPIIKDDYEYILYKGKMYHLNKKCQDLLSSLNDNGLDKLVINENRFDDFTKGLLSVIKPKLNIDSKIDNIVIPKEIKTKLYFDMKTDTIIVNPKFIYDNVTIEYFQSNNSVLRDMEYETKVINDILKYGFEIQNKKIILKDINLQVEFIEDGLEELANKYEVFTTENFKKTSIKKKMNISSTFKIGQDNILSYDFKLDGIDNKELLNIFKNMKEKRKYYRLKNGNIINLQDDSLQELSNLTEELYLTDDDIILGKGTILKYRAIYLDSLKKSKYNIINTNNLFDDFINKFYQYKDSELTLDKEDLKILRDYQTIGVKWLYNLAQTGFGGILADEMGLGKTIQVIYYIKQMLKDNNNYKFLIVVPTSLAYNWENEFEKYAPDIKRIVCVGTKDRRQNILNKLNNINVLITTYGLLREDKEIYDNLSFNTMIIDEAQNIKNNMAAITRVVKGINAETRFALTGTPLENSVLELWSIFDFIMPGYLASLTKFQSKYKIKDFDEDSEILLKGLSKQINPFILRRKKIDVIKELPEKIENNIYVELSDEQKLLYVDELNRVKEEMDYIMETEGVAKARFLILQLLTKLRQLCIDPRILYEDYNGNSNKIDALMSLVNNYINNGDKILIFSSFKTAFAIVKNELDKNKINYYMIDGSVPSKARMEMVEDFNQNDNVKVFLIMLKSGGTGLNLASANVVIHLDLWWNPQAENQATDRAHRIGQKRVVEVIRLITKGTIEEKILELQEKKRILSDKLIDGEKRDKNIINELTKEDIENLLSYENKD